MPLLTAIERLGASSALYVGDSEVDAETAAAAPQLQAQCFHAFFEVWREDNWLEGVYIWNWFGPRQLDDRGYSPRGKPTEALLRQWFKRPEGISQTPLDLHMNNAPSPAHER